MNLSQTFLNHFELSEDPRLDNYNRRHIWTRPHCNRKFNDNGNFVIKVAVIYPTSDAMYYCGP
jgi:hypothetical protein